MKRNPALIVGTSFLWLEREAHLPVGICYKETKKTRKLCKIYYETLNTELL